LMRDRSDAKRVRVLPSDLADGFMQIELEKVRPGAYKLIHQRGGAVDDVEIVLMDGPPRGHPPADAPAPKKAAPKKDEPAPPRPDDDVLLEGMSHYGLGEPDFVTKDVR
jgi:hypothetical protein